MINVFFPCKHGEQIWHSNSIPSFSSPTNRYFCSPASPKKVFYGNSQDKPDNVGDLVRVCIPSPPSEAHIGFFPGFYTTYMVDGGFKKNMLFFYQTAKHIIASLENDNLLVLDSHHLQPIYLLHNNTQNNTKSVMFGGNV